MSIRKLISGHVGTGLLRALSPAIAGDKPLVRGVFVSNEVWSLVGDDVDVDEKLERPSGQARARLDSFSFGKSIVFALNPRNKSVHSDIARNAPISDGVVDLRVTNPKPSLRIFGAFADKDLLVLLNWELRENMDFDAEIKKCKLNWHGLFPHHPALIGNTHDEYLTKPFVVG
ncbi:hypothetical protein C6558_36010 [Ensifer sp. NM-2]|nr:hypothetical protein C6558_36010 [Ensifer sp. NM-2]